ncbi:MAG TPA: archease [Candidatus Nanoarchaeia archaeon]|nr:archease [Candidatus Nanoarchaeia archaeon]
MKPSYTFLEHTADVLFQASAPTINELFEQCALAVEDTQVDIALVQPAIAQKITLKNKTLERLLFDFLEELVFYKDSELLVFSQFKVKVQQKGGEYNLVCQAEGDKLSHQKHDPKVDVKAVTMHLFQIKKITGGWQAQVLLDI